MELWIRSQDKEALMKVNNGVLYHQTEDMRDCIVINESPSYYHIIGAYKTKERALEVLDEIQNLLQPKIIYTQKEPIETFELGVYKLKQDVDIKIQEVNRIVYEMPQD